MRHLSSIFVLIALFYSFTTYADSDDMQLQRLVCHDKNNPNFVVVVDQKLEQPNATEDNFVFADFNPAGKNRIDGRYLIPGNSQYGEFANILIDVNVQVFKNAQSRTGQKIDSNNYKEVAKALVDSEPIKDSNLNNPNSSFEFIDDATLLFSMRANGAASSGVEWNDRKSSVEYHSHDLIGNRFRDERFRVFVNCYPPYAYDTFSSESQTASGYGYGYRPKATTAPKAPAVSN